MLESKISRKLTFHARHSLKESSDIARSTHASVIEPRHLLFAIFMEKGSLGSVLLENMGFEQETLEKICLAESGSKTTKKKADLAFSPQLKSIIIRAYSLASSFSYPYVGSEHLIYALIESSDPVIQTVLETMSIKKKDIHSLLKANFGSADIPHLSRIFNLPDIGLSRKDDAPSDETPFLDQFGNNVTQEMEETQELITGRTKEIERMVQVIGRKNKNNPLLIGEPGVGKTTLVNALAKKILNGEAGHVFSGKKIIALDLALVVAGTNFRGEFEGRLKEIIREASEHPDIILFIDEIHTILGAGNSTGGLDAANILKPALSRGDIQCIGATTLAEYKRHIEKDPAFERRFQPIYIAEPTLEETKTILHESKPSYETFHHASITPEAIDAAVELSVRYIPDRFLPDKAFDLLDEAASRARQSTPKNPLIASIRKLESMKREQSAKKQALVKSENFEEAAKLREEEKLIGQEIRKLNAKLKKSEKQSFIKVDASDIARVVANITHIPFEKISSTKHPHLTALNKTLSAAVIGQQEAVDKISQTLTRSFSGIGNPDRPLGSFLFLGPSGVGKTLTAKILAESLFEDKHALIRLDMSEFMERHSIAQIIGAPAGYVGYGEGGKLTEKVRHKPYSVILFDEIEKAHPDVFNLLLQILEEGMLTDAEGKKISFRNTVIILTSNIGTYAFNKAADIGFHNRAETKAHEHEFETIQKTVLGEVKYQIRPEILNRLDHIVVFRPLDALELEAVTQLEMNLLGKRIAKQGKELKHTKQLIHFLAQKSFSTDQGARLVRKNIQDLVELPLAQAILEHPEIRVLSLEIKKDAVVLKTPKK